MSTQTAGYGSEVSGELIGDSDIILRSELAKVKAEDVTSVDKLGHNNLFCYQGQLTCRKVFFFVY
jgi:hypothetical protein